MGGWWSVCDRAHARACTGERARACVSACRLRMVRPDSRRGRLGRPPRRRMFGKPRLEHVRRTFETCLGECLGNARSDARRAAVDAVRNGDK
eukprot:273980-Pleurochrysis_carterae.AAC.2